MSQWRILRLQHNRNLSSAVCYGIRSVWGENPWQPLGVCQCKASQTYAALENDGQGREHFLCINSAELSSPNQEYNDVEWAHVLADRLYSRIYAANQQQHRVTYPFLSVGKHLRMSSACWCLLTGLVSLKALYSDVQLSCQKIEESLACCLQDEGAPPHLYSEVQPFCQRLYALKIVIQWWQKRKQAPKRHVSILKRKGCLISTAVPDSMINATNKQLEGCLCWTCYVCGCLCSFLIQQIQGKRAQLCFFASLANPEKATICRFQKS